MPSLLERTGDFSELLNPTLTGASGPIQLYHQSSASQPQPFPNNNLATGISGVTPNANILTIINMLPKPNTNNGLLYSNYLYSEPSGDDTTQWDTRMDWVSSPKDTVSSGFSYWNEPSFQAPLFGVLDGGGRVNKNESGSFMISETHVFTPTLTNEFRMGFNFIRAQRLQINDTNTGLATSLGFGGVPSGPLNGGTPSLQLVGSTPNISQLWHRRVLAYQ